MLDAKKLTELFKEWADKNGTREADELWDNLRKSFICYGDRLSRYSSLVIALISYSYWAKIPTDKVQKAIEILEIEGDMIDDFI